MNNPEDPLHWLDFCDRLAAFGTRLAGEVTIPLTEKGAADPKMLAATLLIRTLSNFQAAVILVRNGHVLEARILARNCVENAFWLGALQADPDGFAREIASDEVRSRQSLIALARDHTRSLDGTYHAKLGELSAALEAQWPKARQIAVKAAAEKSVLSSLYLQYRHLSSQAAHPSVTSLSRYLHRDNCSGLRGLDLSPPAIPGEAGRALHAGCLALLSVCVAFNQFAGPVPFGLHLHALADEFDELSATMNMPQ